MGADGFFDFGEADMSGFVSPSVITSGKKTASVCVLVSQLRKEDYQRGAAGMNPVYRQALGDASEGCIYRAFRLSPGHADSATIQSERELFRKWLAENPQIRKVVVCGETCFRYLVGHKFTELDKLTFEAVVGANIPDIEYGVALLPVWDDTTVIMRSREKTPRDPVWKLYLEQMQHAVDAPEFCSFEDPFSEWTTSEKDLEDIRSGVWAMDYETTGVKPHAPGHSIYCVSFSNGRKTISVRCTDYVLQQLRRIVTDSAIKLVAHNLQFEDAWTFFRAGTEVKNWYWDTMLGAHVLDNRARIAKLKLQVYLHFGVSGYDDSVQSYIKSADKKNKNALNTIYSAPEKEVLEYCARDSFYTALIYRKQFPLLQDSAGYSLLFQGAQELARVERRGFLIDEKKLKKNISVMTEKIREHDSAIRGNADIMRWEMANGKKFNPNSPIMLQSFFDSVGEKFIKVTATGADSVDAETLQTFRHPVAADILELKKCKKLRDTFLSGLKVESVAGVIHPLFSLASVTSYRSSCSAPNAQNWPKRDPVAEEIIRGVFTPRPGHLLLEVDYSGIEVRVGAAYHNDPRMIHYIQNPENDMHRDVAAQIFCMPIADVDKGRRQFVKSGFVFSQFYGSWYKQCADNMWRDMPSEWKRDLADKGIKTLAKFTRHIQIIEEDFWQKRFRVYNAWKKRQWSDYMRNRVIHSHTGFEYRNITDSKIVSNYPIQGSAFHCLLWSLIQMGRWLRRKKMKTSIIGQIHDSMILDVCPEELEAVKIQLRRVMVERLREVWQWINVPLDIEAEVSDIDGNWSETKKTKI